MGSKEILTLQLGHYANFVGTHWWNLQENSFEYSGDKPSEINHDVLYREGLNERNQTTYTPRTLIVDLKGSLGSLNKHGELYNQEFDDNVEWDFKVEQITEPKVPKNTFLKDLEKESNDDQIASKSYNLEEEVKVWSDFCYTRFHPKSVNIVNDYQHCNENTPFDAFPLGGSLWKTEQFEDGFSDKIRSYVEECDSFQGFHLLTDATNAFSGLSTSCSQYLYDEYSRKALLAFPLIPSFFEDNVFTTDAEKHKSVLNDSVRVLNLLFCFQQLSEFTSLTVPLSLGKLGWRQPGEKIPFNLVEYNERIPYHSSAILSAALDTFTLKHRLKSNNGFSLVDLCADLNAYSRKIASASLCIPFGMNEDSNLLSCLDNWQGPLTKSITPKVDLATDYMMQHFTIRGIPNEKLKLPIDKAIEQRDLPAYRCRNVQEMFNFYLAYSTHSSANHVTAVDKALIVKNPFPKIFNKSIGHNGFISEKLRVDNTVDSVPILAGLHNGKNVGEMLENLHTEAKRIRFGKFHQFLSEGLTQDDFNDMLDKFFDLRENYEDNYLI